MRGTGRGSLEALPSGKVRASWYPPGGARQRRTFADRDDAEDWLAEQRIAVKRGIWQPARAQAPTVADYLARWIVERRNAAGQPLRPVTVADYQGILRRKIAPHPIGGMSLDEVTAADVRSWYATMDGTPGSQSRAYVLLAAMYRTAIEDSLVDHSPCRIRGGATQAKAHRTVVLSPPEVRALAEAMPAHLSVAVLLAAYGALRAGELFALRRSDVAPDGSAVHVVRAVTWTKGARHVRAPKSAAGVRTVAMPPHVWADIVAHMETWTGPAPDDPVVTSSTGAMLRHSTLHHAFYPARDTIGRPDLRWHDLRHTGATMAAQAGATLAELQQRIGHSTVDAAMRYQHATSERDQQIAARLSEMATTPVLRAVP